MAGGSSAATEPAPGESGREQETPHVENETSQRQTEGGAQQDNNDPPSPPLPPRPLPPAHHENLKGQRPLPPLPPLPKGVHFGPLPIEQPRVPSLDYGRREYPVWHKAKLGMMTLSLMVCAVIFGVGIAMGFHNVAWAWDVVPVDYEFGTSAAAAGLAVVVSVVELLTTCLSRRQEGMHPGAHVAFHLIIWLLALIAVVVTAIYNGDSSYYYYYPDDEETDLHLQNSLYEQVLLGFLCTLLFIHFILFVGACAETDRLAKAKRKVVMVQVPVPTDGSYPEGQYPVYGPPHRYAPQPGTHPGQYPVPMMAQVPFQGGEGTGPTHPQAAALYGGYYAPAPASQQGMAWTAPQQGYYAPTPTPARRTSDSRRHSQRSQRHTQRQSTAQPAEQQTVQHEQARPSEPVSEKTT